jgi:hypothetical protein
MTEHHNFNTDGNLSGTVLADDGTAKSGVPILVRHVESDKLVIDRAYGKTTDVNGNFTIDGDNDPIPVTYASGTEIIEMLEIWAEFGDGDATSQGESLYDSGGKARMYPIAYSLQAVSVDDFDDQDLSEYTVVGNNVFGINTSNPIEGSASLGVSRAGISQGGSSDLIMSDAGEGLDNYPEKGDVFSCIMYEPGQNNTFPHFGFGADKGSVTGYLIGWFPANSNEIRIRRLDGEGSVTDLAIDSDSVYSNYIAEPAELEVEWHDGSGSETDNTIVLRAYELDSSLNRVQQIGSKIKATDSNYETQRGTVYTVGSGDPDEGLFADRYRIEGSV